MIQERIDTLAKEFAEPFEPQFKKVAAYAYKQGLQNMKDELMELANLAYSMREAQKEFCKLRYSQHHDKRAEAGERMADLQKTMDAELREILELED